MSCSLSFVPSGSAPLYQQLYRYIREEILSGRLASGEKLPSKRQLSKALSVSVVTVEGAYSQLVAEGYLQSRNRSGFYVLPVLPRPETAPAPAPAPALPDLTRTSPPCRYDFATSGGDASSFPFSTWARLSREVLSSRDQALLSAAHSQGVPELRQAIVRHLYQFRGIQVSPEQIVVGAGSEFLTALLVQLLGAKGGYAVEDPGYGKIARIFHASGAEVCPIPLDSQGLMVDQLEASGARVVHVTPSHHFPLGIVMPVSRRTELLRWADQGEERYIIEDDYDSEFRFSGRPIPALQGLDRSGRVIYLNTFAKSLAPSLRISYMVLPPRLLERYRRELLFYSSTVPSFEQYTLALFMERGHMDRHIARTRNRYQQRRSAMSEAVRREGLEDICIFSGGESGLHQLMQVRTRRPQDELTRLAAENGVRLYPLDTYYLCEPPHSGLPTYVMGYGKLDNADLQDSFHLLASAWAF
ncbi:MAG: PLP-dependent aminotransferase family protein [Clostridiales bacterium]|nr:PLP-dependent aminotransferase family protein [Clostridiales bacterium]